MLVALVGQPNSGKSALLARLTGARVMTSNYPGTTVELTKGSMKGLTEDSPHVTILDTPGIYSLAASSREQEVTRDVLLNQNPDLIVNVLDATNLERHLSLTLSLLELGLPMILAINAADRLGPLGIYVDVRALSAATGADVVLTSALSGEGIEELKTLIRERGRKGQAWASGDKGSRPAAGRGQAPQLDGGQAALPRPWRKSHLSVGEPDLRRYQEGASRVAADVVRYEGGRTKRKPDRPGARRSFEDRLDRPLFSWLVLGLSLAVSWKAVAWALPFAEIAVRALLAPLSLILERFLAAALPPGVVADTLSRAIPEGLTLPMATVLPAMILAYTLIALLEDSGLLGRYAALGDALMRTLGLPGQALIPFMLAFGCRVPALLSARILPSAESRKAASVIIASTVPCAATVSLALAALLRFGGNPLVPGVAVLASMVLLGRLLGLARGRARDPLILELPPLRIPILRNVVMKTQMRLAGFFGHVLPLVVGMNVAVRLFASHGPGMGWPAVTRFTRGALGIPPEALLAVVLTMLQRYLAPLFLLQLPLTPREATIAVTMVALGLPCLPSAATIWREMGFRTVALTFALSIFLSLGWGMFLNLVM